MRRLIRDTHLWLGLFFFAFVLAYGVSSVQMAHPDWFHLEPTVTVSRATLAPSAALDPALAADQLRAEHGLRGDLQQVEVDGDSVRFRIVRPGTVHEVRFSRSTGSAEIRTSVAGVLGMLNRIHHVHGLGHDYAVINVWGALVALVSVALLLLGVTGTYLWFRMHRERVVGGVLLALSLGYTLLLIVLIRIA